ncbi:MAG: hypothetical protein IJ144_05630 [Prevotella sp.]|nr:hypothetical protein [Prevotella sp.]
MKKIKIFVAGSKNLVQERNYIKILANDLNSVYNSSDVMITIHSYEHFNDKQDEYNRFIENDADMVIFILDGRIGEKTKEEFLKATEALNRESRPEVIVFLHDFTEETADIGRIQGLIHGRLGDKYYVDYSNLEDLRTKARERIVRFIDKSKNTKDTLSAEQKPGDHKIKEHHSRLKALILLMSIAIVALCIGLCWNLSKSSDLLIFAGGGSVKNYIESTKGIDIAEYPHSVYANLASGSAWALLTEEANRYQEDGGKGQEHFSSICLSADNIDSTFINEKTKGVFANARIIRYNLGSDPLVVYVHNKILQEKHIPMESVSISVDSLRSLIKFALTEKNRVRLFTTSKTSGTLRLYQSCFNTTDSINFEQLLDSSRSYLFYKKSTSAYINALDIPNDNQPYIILGSQYYYPQTIDTEKEKQYRALYVKNGEENVSKPMNIYFVGKYNAAEADFCTIKKPVIQFLKDIHADENIDKDTWRELIKGRKKTEGGDLILKLN